MDSPDPEMCDDVFDNGSDQESEEGPESNSGSEFDYGSDYED